MNRVAGFPHQRFAAVPGDPAEQVARAFDVENDFAAGHARQHVGREQHQLAIGVNDPAGLGDHAEAVAVAVKGQPEFGIAIFQRGDEVFEVVRLRRIGMVVGKGAVDFAEQFFDGATEFAVQPGSGGAGDAVAAVDGDAHGAVPV